MFFSFSRQNNKKSVLSTSRGVRTELSTDDVAIEGKNLKKVAKLLIGSSMGISGSGSEEGGSESDGSEWGGIDLGIDDSSNLELLDEFKGDQLDADAYGGASILQIQLLIITSNVIILIIDIMFVDKKAKPTVVKNDPSDIRKAQAKVQKFIADSQGARIKLRKVLSQAKHKHHGLLQEKLKTAPGDIEDIVKDLEAQIEVSTTMTLRILISLLFSTLLLLLL